MNHHAASSSNRVEYLKFVGLLFAILFGSFIYASVQSDMNLNKWMEIFMGVFLITFASFKFAGYRMFIAMFRGYDIIAKRFFLYALAYPFIEIVLGFVYLADVFDFWRDILLFIVMSIGSIGVFQEIYHRRSGTHCACLGNIIKLPLSTVSLVEDVSMALMAGYMLLV